MAGGDLASSTSLPSSVGPAKAASSELARCAAGQPGRALVAMHPYLTRAPCPGTRAVQTAPVGRTKFLPRPDRRPSEPRAVLTSWLESWLTRPLGHSCADPHGLPIPSCRSAPVKRQRAINRRATQCHKVSASTVPTCTEAYQHALTRPMCTK